MSAPKANQEIRGTKRGGHKPPRFLLSRMAKRRLAAEYDAAQERGEVATGRDGPRAGVTDGNAKITAAEVGLSRKDIHDARRVDRERVGNRLEIVL